MTITFSGETICDKCTLIFDIKTHLVYTSEITRSSKMKVTIFKCLKQSKSIVLLFFSFSSGYNLLTYLSNGVLLAEETVPLQFLGS